MRDSTKKIMKEQAFILSTGNNDWNVHEWERIWSQQGKQLIITDKSYRAAKVGRLGFGEISNRYEEPNLPTVIQCYFLTGSDIAWQKCSAHFRFLAASLMPSSNLLQTSRLESSGNPVNRFTASQQVVERVFSSHFFSSRISVFGSLIPGGSISESTMKMEEGKGI